MTTTIPIKTKLAIKQPLNIFFIFFFKINHNVLQICDVAGLEAVSLIVPHFFIKR
jgi:hypothetical protein